MKHAVISFSDAGAGEGYVYTGAVDTGLSQSVAGSVSVTPLRVDLPNGVQGGDLREYLRNAVRQHVAQRGVMGAAVTFNDDDGGQVTHGDDAEGKPPHLSGVFRIERGDGPAVTPAPEDLLKMPLTQ